MPKAKVFVEKVLKHDSVYEISHVDVTECGHTTFSPIQSQEKISGAEYLDEKTCQLFS